jgi:hypothetical protein
VFVIWLPNGDCTLTNKSAREERDWGYKSCCWHKKGKRRKKTLLVYNNESLFNLLLCRYLRSILSRQSSAHSISELIESLNAIDSWVQIYHTNRNLNISLMIPVTYFVDSDTGGHGMILC